MLLVQSITLTWSPRERGGQAAAARARFPLACPVEERALAASPDGAVVQTLRFFQDGDTILTAEEECRRGLQVHLTRQGLSPAKVEELIARRLREMREVRVLAYPDHTHLNLTNLTFRPAGEGWEVGFWWDERRSGLPPRRGHNRDFHDPDSRLYYKDCLNESAFVLAPGQVGRVLWNERRRDFDDGTWYYQLQCRNIAALAEGQAAAGGFTDREPDFIYRQMAELY